MTETNNILIVNKHTANRTAFSLIEIITVMLISSMVIIGTLAVFHQVRKATASVNARLDKVDVADEILQRIAEDLDRLAIPGFDTRVTLRNKIANGHNKSRLTIEKKFYDKNNKPQTFEKIVWQSEYDVMEERLILYRYHGGLSLEDKILDGELQAKQSDGTERYIPLSDEITVFEIVVPRKDANPHILWLNETLPPSIAVRISFAEPVENIDGTFEVPEEDIIVRNIAIDRTRKPKFVFKKKDFTRPEEDEDADPNDLDSKIDDAGKKDDKKSDDAKKKDKPLGKASSTRPK